MLESVAGFIDSDASVTVILPETGPLEQELVRLGAAVRIAPTFVVRKALLKPRNWGTLIASFFRGGWAALSLLRSIRPDALYVSTVTIPLWPILGRLTRTRSLLHIHEAEQGASTVMKKALYAPALFPSAIVVNSRFARDVLGSAYRSAARRATVVYNAVPGPQSSTPARRSLDGELRLVYVGRLSPRKGPDLIVEAMSRETDIPTKLDIVGAVFPGYEWYEDQLRSRVAELGLSDRVRFLGFHKDVWSIVDAADACVVPSRFDEPFGNTAVEGVLAGRVVLVSDTSGLREATSDVDTAILFAPDDAVALASAIATCYQSWPSLVAGTQNAAKQVAERYSPSRYRREMTRQLQAVTVRHA